MFGPEWVQSDREARIAGYTADAGVAFAKLPAEMQTWLRAYAAGVNAWTAAHREAVTRRFLPLGVEPEPWTLADCLPDGVGHDSRSCPAHPAGPVTGLARTTTPASKRTA